MRRRPRWEPSDADLAALNDHLVHEVQLTFVLAEQLMAPATSHVELCLRDAHVEAFAVHLRQLVRFFWGGRALDERIALAADYFIPGEWARIRPEMPALLKQPRIGFARLEYGGAFARPTDEVWDAVSQAFALGPVVKCFAQRVNPELIAYADAMRIAVELFEQSRGTTRRVA